MTARGEADFGKFAPVLEEWVALVREASSLIDASRPPYDVALEEFEKGMTSSQLDSIFMQARRPVLCLDTTPLQVWIWHAARWHRAREAFFNPSSRRHEGSLI